MEKSGKNIYNQQHEAQFNMFTSKKASKLARLFNKCSLA